MENIFKLIKIEFSLNNFGHYIDWYILLGAKYVVLPQRTYRKLLTIKIMFFSICIMWDRDNGKDYDYHGIASSLMDRSRFSKMGI